MKNIFTYLLIFFSFSAFSQKRIIDSLTKQLEKKRVEINTIIDENTELEKEQKQAKINAEKEKNKNIVLRNKIKENNKVINLLSQINKSNDSLIKVMSQQINFMTAQLKNISDENQQLIAREVLIAEQNRQIAIKDSIKIAQLNEKIDDLVTLNNTLKKQTSMLYRKIDAEVLTVIAYQRRSIRNVDTGGQILDEKNTHNVRGGLIEYINIETNSLFNLDKKSYKYELKYYEENEPTKSLIKDGRIEGSGSIKSLIPLMKFNFQDYQKGYFILRIYFEVNETGISFEKKFSIK